MPSLLIYTATIDDQMRAETKASIEAQVADIDITWEVGKHNPFPGEKMRNVVAQYQRARQMALEGGYDALLTVEDDMVIPPDAVQKLYETDAPVVYGVYMLRHGTHTLSAWQYIGDKNLGMSLSLYPDEVRRYWQQGWARVCGVGWGCTLIRREVLERVQIYSAEPTDAGDLTFARNCLAAGFVSIARFDVPCLHIEPDGNVLEPTYRGGIVSRVLALQTFNANVGGQSLPMKKDRYYTVPRQVGFDLQRAGYVFVTNLEDDEEEIGEREQPDISAREMAINPKAATRKTRKAK